MPTYCKLDGGVTSGIRMIQNLEPIEMKAAIEFAGGNDNGRWAEKDFIDPVFLVKHNCKNCVIISVIARTVFCLIMFFHFFALSMYF